MKSYSTVFKTIFILSTHIFPLAKSEVFTALVDMEPLLDTQVEILKVLEQYIDVEEDRLSKVKWLTEEYKKLHTAASKDAKTFLSNPVNAYLLLKRLTADWETLDRLTGSTYSRDLIEDIMQQDLPFPDLEDLSGAAAALLRLQEVYLLNATQMAQGEIKGAVAVSSKLTAGDCYELGREALKLEDYDFAYAWMQEALNRLPDEEFKTADKRAVLEFAAYSSFEMGNMEQAINFTKDLISIAPNHTKAYKILSRYQDAQFQDLRERDQEFPIGEGTHPNFNSEESAEDNTSINYEKLCRGERIKTAREESQLTCRYTSNNSSYLLLQPVKEEVLNLDPKIVMYYDIISDKDIELFKELALPRLARAAARNSETGLLEAGNFRVSKSAWLNDTDHPRVEYASYMIKEITGLETNTAEKLHLINYGIGGHYEPHIDFKREGDADEFAHLGTGNRIATWIYYLSDVDAGGSTVFPYIGVEVKPVKGSAAFWYNLRTSGEGDMLTVHAGCPVLIGSKWVANKWFHEKNQEFRRPCSLNRWE